MIIKILNDILRGRELTACNNHTYWMNKYRSNWYQIDEEIGLCLIQSNAIVEDSANFETGETHYILDCDYMFYDKLNNMNLIFNKLNSNLKYGKEIINILRILILREERKIKLKKIKTC